MVHRADVGFEPSARAGWTRAPAILDADIGMSDVFGRSARRFFRDDVAGALQEAHPEQRLARVTASWRGEAELCTYAAEAASEFGFAIDLLAARDGLDDDSP